jgi:hypothetical protein
MKKIAIGIAVLVVLAVVGIYVAFNQLDSIVKAANGRASG